MSDIAAEAGTGRADECVDAISRSVKAVVAGDLEAARVALAPIASDVWAGMPPWRRPARTRERATVLISERRSFTPARAAATFVRDRFQCCYCGQRVIPVSLMSVLSLLFPAELPYVSIYKQGYVHRA